MAIDVAVLRAKLRFESEGSNQAAQDAQKVEQAVRGVERAVSSQIRTLAGAEETIQNAMSASVTAAQSSSAAVRKAGDDAAAAVEGYYALIAGVEGLENRLHELGATLATAGQVTAQYMMSSEAATAAAAAYNEQIKALEEEVKSLTSVESIAAQGRAGTYEQAKAQAAKLREEIKRLKEEQESLGDEASRDQGIAQEIQNIVDSLRSIEIPREANRRLADVQKATKGVADATGNAAQKQGFFNRLLGQFNNGGGLTISNLASMAARATGLGIAAVVAVRAITQLVQFLGRLASRAIEAADATNLYSEATIGAANSLGNFQGQGAALLSFLDKATNRWRSYGNSVEDARAASVAVASVANVAQFFDATPGNEAQVLDQIQRAVESLNFDSLRTLGIDVGRVNESFRQLAEDGVSLAIQRQAAFAEISRQVAARQGEAVNQLNRERETLAGVRLELDRMITGLLQSEEGRSVIRSLVQEIRNALPIIAQFAQLFGILVVGALKLATAALPPLITGLINLSEATLTFGQHLPFFGKMIRSMAELTGVDLDNISEGFDAAREKLADLADIQIPDDFFDNIMSDLPGIGNGLEDVTRNLRDLRAEASQGSSLAGQIQSLGDAFVAMQEDLNPRTAMTALNQFSNVIDSVIENGIDSLDAFRLRAQAAFELGFFNEAELAAAQSNFDNIESILGPIAQKAEDLRAEQERLAQAKLTGLQGEFQQTESAVSSARTETQEFISVLNSIPAQVSTDVVVNYRATGDPSGRGLVPGDLSYYRGGAATTGQQGSRRGGSGGPPPQVNTAPTAMELRQIKEKAEAGATANQPAGISQAEQERLRADLARQGRFGRGGGGGGGGGDSALATIEQLREFFTEVNRAIAIAANGGVRIGTAGNAIPFDEGTFLNSKGGGLSVDTILIRGVWDFADPAMKRQIIRELKEALAGLEAEV